MEKNIIERKKIEELQKIITEQRNNIALAKGFVSDPGKRQFIKKGILGIIMGLGIAVFSKIAHAGGIIFNDDSTLFGDISVRAYHSVNQSISNTTSTVVALNSERWDTDTIHDTVTNNSRLTCKTAGKYIITANIEWDTSSTGERQLLMRLNGTTTIALSANLPMGGAFLDTTQSVNTIYDLAVNDYVEMFVNQNSGGALNLMAKANWTPEFAMVKIA